MEEGICPHLVGRCQYHNGKLEDRPIEISCRRLPAAATSLVTTFFVSDNTSNTDTFQADMGTPNTNGDAEQYYQLPIDSQRQQPSSTPSSSGSMLPRIEAPEPQQFGLIVAFSHKLMHITILERFASNLGNWHTFYIKAFLATTHRNILSFRRPNGSWDTERMPEYLLTRLGRIHPTALDEYMKSRERLPCDFLVEIILVSIKERVEKGQRNIMFIGFPGSEEFLRKFCEMVSSYALHCARSI